MKQWFSESNDGQKNIILKGLLVSILCFDIVLELIHTSVQLFALYDKSFICEAIR